METSFAEEDSIEENFDVEGMSEMSTQPSRNNSFMSSFVYDVPKFDDGLKLINDVKLRSRSEKRCKTSDNGDEDKTLKKSNFSRSKKSKSDER